MLTERGIIVSYESIRRRFKKFGPAYARRIKTRLAPRGDVWHRDEMVINSAKYHMRIAANMSVRCEGFSLWAMPNVSSQYMVKFTICFTSVDICFVHTIIDYCELAPSRRGTK